MNHYIADAADMAALAAEIVAMFEYPTVVHLRGELGAGKTTLVREILSALGYPGTVKSPTYSLYETYCVNGRTVHHLDLYRLTDPEELDYIGFRDLLDADLLLIEWPERGAEHVPRASLTILIDYAEPGRNVMIQRAAGTGGMV